MFYVGEIEIIVLSFQTSLKVCMFIVCALHLCLYVSSLVKFIDDASFLDVGRVGLLVTLFYSILFVSYYCTY